MSIFKHLFHSRDKPKIENSLNSNIFSPFFSNSSSGKSVNQQSAMQITAVYSCVRILSEAVAGLPLNTYKYTKSGSKEKATEHSLYKLLHDEPNPEMSAKRSPITNCG